MSDIENLKETLAFSKGRLSHWSSRVINLTAEVRKLCPHTDITTTKKDYDDEYSQRWDSIITHRCAGCGKQWREDKSEWYGGR